MTDMDRFLAPEDRPCEECDPFEGKSFSPILLALGDAEPSQLNVVGLSPGEVLAHGTLTLELGPNGNVHEALWVPYPVRPRRGPRDRRDANAGRVGQ